MTKIVTTSLLKAFLNCPIEAYYMEQGLQQPQRPGSPLQRGSFIHELLETGTAPVEPEGLFDEELELYRGYTRLVEAYRWNWRNDPWRRLRAEFKLSRPIKGYDAVYQGKADELVLIDDTVWLVDHKTHVEIPCTEFRLLDIQSDAYTWLLMPWLKRNGLLDGTHPKGYKFGGFCWDYLVMNKIKTPALVADGTRFRRIAGGKLPFTDYTTLRRVLLETGCAQERQCGDGTIEFTGKLAPDEQVFIRKELMRLHSEKSAAFQRYFVPFDSEAHARQVKLLKKSIRAFLEFDFGSRPMLRNPMLCGNSYLCSFSKLAVAELATGSDEMARSGYVQGDPLARYKTK